MPFLLLVLPGPAPDRPRTLDYRPVSHGTSSLAHTQCSQDRGTLNSIYRLVESSAMGSVRGGHVDEGALQAVTDRFAVQDVVLAYLDRVDALDPEGAAAHFALTGRADYMTRQPVVGRAAIAAALARLLPRFSVTSHHVTNLVVSVDQDTATASSYVYAYHRLVETGEPWRCPDRR
jgi:hypothetical protein